ncbi:hypothetical protein HID58_094115, partial [Brassica napus]
MSKVWRRVKFWITLNQPYSLASKGYGDGSYPPPGRCTGCEFGGDSGIEPYIKLQGGKIGTTLIGRWFTPLNENSIHDTLLQSELLRVFVD